MKQSGATYIVWWYRLVLSSFFAGVGAYFVAMIIGAAEVAAAIFGLFGLVFSLGMLSRSVRCAAVHVDDNGVVIRGLRVRQIQWSAISGAHVDEGSSVLPIGWRVPCIDLKDGGVVCAHDVRSIRRWSIVDEVVHEIESRLQSDTGT